MENGSDYHLDPMGEINDGHKPPKNCSRIPDPPPPPKKNDRPVPKPESKWRKFWRQLEESEGFDCDEILDFEMPPGGIHQARCDQKRWPEMYEEYMTIAKFAIEDYNTKNNTEFVVSQVESVNMIWSYAQTYFMTFTANNVVKAGESDPTSAGSSVSKIFQAKVCARTSGIQQFKILEFCRLKAEK